MKPFRTASQIRSAHERRVGGMRKRCRKGKNCSAACIAPDMACLVNMPIPASTASSKVSKMLMARQEHFKGRMAAPSAPRAEMLKPSPENQQLKSLGKSTLRELANEKFQGLTAAQKAGAEAKQARRAEAEEKSRKKVTAGLDWTKEKNKGPAPPSLQPFRGAPTADTGQAWFAKYSGRSEDLNTQLNALRAKIGALPPEQQAYWNEQINKQMNPRLASRNGTPYTPEKITKSLTSQTKAWQDLIEWGPPTQLTNRKGDVFPAPKGMRPDVSSGSGQRKWFSPDDGLLYSGGKGTTGWRQNRAATKDTDRRLNDISEFRKSQKEKGEQWPTQNLPAAKTGLASKSVDEIMQTLRRSMSASDLDEIVFNGLDKSGNEGVQIRKWYNANPAEKEARFREIVQRWKDQGGLSGISGKPVAIPGMNPKPGEERSTIDHFTPISTNRAAKLSPAEIRKLVDNGKNFLIAEEAPNSQRSSRPWDSWLDKKESQATKTPKAPSAPKESKKPPESAPPKSKPYEVAVTQGRFNIPHLGHVKMIQEMLERADTAHVLIGRGKDNIDQDLRSQLLRAALRHEGVDLSRVKLIKQENMMQYAPALAGKVGEKKAIAVLGEDQEKFLQGVGKASKMDTHLVPRGAGGASSTKIREMIDSGDWAGLRAAYGNDPYLMRLARAARSVEKEPEKWGVQKEAKSPAKPKGGAKPAAAKAEEGTKTPPPRKIETKPRAKKEEEVASTPAPRKIETKPAIKKEEASTTKLTVQELTDRVTQTGKEWARLNGTPQGSAARAEFEKAKADLDKAKQEAQAAPSAAKASSMLEGLKQAANPQSARGLTWDQDEKVDTAARMTNYRIDKRLNERQFYDDATNAKIKAQNEKVVAPFQKMNENEKAALSLYGQDGVKYYAQVNQLLRTGQMEDSTPEKVKMAEFISGNLRSGLERLPPAQVEQLGRAVKGDFATSLASLKPGDVITDKGFGSYTDKGNPVYDQFFGKTGSNAAIRILNPKSAREVAPVMEYAREGEHITLPGTKLRLVDVQEKGVYSRKTGGYIPQYTFEEVSE